MTLSIPAHYEVTVFTAKFGQDRYYFTQLDLIDKSVELTYHKVPEAERPVRKLENGVVRWIDPKTNYTVIIAILIGERRIETEVTHF